MESRKPPNRDLGEKFCGQKERCENRDDLKSVRDQSNVEAKKSYGQDRTTGVLTLNRSIGKEVTRLDSW